MKSQPQNPEFRNNPENFHPCNKPPDQTDTHTYCSFLLYCFCFFLFPLSFLFDLWSREGRFLKSELHNLYQCSYRQV